MLSREDLVQATVRAHAVKNALDAQRQPQQAQSPLPQLSEEAEEHLAGLRFRIHEPDEDTGELIPIHYGSTALREALITEENAKRTIQQQTGLEPDELAQLKAQEARAATEHAKRQAAASIIQQFESQPSRRERQAQLAARQVQEDEYQRHFARHAPAPQPSTQEEAAARANTLFGAETGVEARWKQIKQQGVPPQQQQLHTSRLLTPDQVAASRAAAAEAQRQAAQAEKARRIAFSRSSAQPHLVTQDIGGGKKSKKRRVKGGFRKRY